MQKRSEILSYLRSSLSSIVLFLFFVLVYSLVFFIFRLPQTYNIYGVILMTAGFLFYLLLDYQKERRWKEKILLYKDLHYRIEDRFSGRDEVYMEVIESLRKDLMEGDSIKDRKLRELKDYYSLWAHQIKLPISAAYLLLEGSEINPSEIKSEVFRIEEYVNSLLAYLQLDSSQTDYVFGEMELDEIVRSSIRRYASLFIRKGIKVDFKPSNKKIISDKKWLGFILNQILSNALKYTEKGMIEIFWKEGSLYIRDSGIGIPYEDLPRIYQRGFTGVNGRGRNNSTGIGLALCKQIGEELHIQIKIESVREGGTTVILTFRE